MTVPASTAAVAQRAMYEIRWRILPLVFAIYLITFLDAPMWLTPN
jgi:hypothetical protein